MAKKQKKAFREFLESQNLRLTREREAIIEHVLRKHGHFDPEELHFELKGNGAKVSRASIYRTIPLLVNAGIIEKVENTDKHAHYELILGRKHHDHMLCTRCGKVIEFYSEGLERLQDRLCKAEGFKGNSHTLEIKGLCSRCNR
ncbi:MAG: transcriptional repressor [Thermodesulfovibrionales bacterium]|nr:transcriptional repressor [Thermodesulfovibrionales bacterium]